MKRYNKTTGKWERFTIKGYDGKSAYELWLAAGNEGSEEDFLDSLRGDIGPQGEKGDKGDKGDIGPQGPQGPQGEKGEIVYSEVQYIAAEEVAKIVVNADSSFDTLKEVANYIKQDDTGSAQLINNVSELNTLAHTHDNKALLDNITSDDVER